MSTISITRFDRRRIVLPDGGEVIVGPIEHEPGDHPTCTTGVQFRRNGETTVQFALTQAARDALLALLASPEVGEPWEPPQIVRWRIIAEYSDGTEREETL